MYTYVLFYAVIFYHEWLPFALLNAIIQSPDFPSRILEVLRMMTKTSHRAPPLYILRSEHLCPSRSFTFNRNFYLPGLRPVFLFKRRSPYQDLRFLLLQWQACGRFFYVSEGPPFRNLRFLILQRQTLGRFFYLSEGPSAHVLFYLLATSRSPPVN